MNVGSINAITGILRTHLQRAYSNMDVHSLIPPVALNRHRCFLVLAAPLILYILLQATIHCVMIVVDNSADIFLLCVLGYALVFCAVMILMSGPVARLICNST